MTLSKKNLDQLHDQCGAVCDPTHANNAHQHLVCEFVDVSEVSSDIVCNGVSKATLTQLTNQENGVVITRHDKHVIIPLSQFRDKLSCPYWVNSLVDVLFQ